MSRFLLSISDEQIMGSFSWYSRFEKIFISSCFYPVLFYICVLGGETTSLSSKASVYAVSSERQPLKMVLHDH